MLAAALKTENCGVEVLDVSCSEIHPKGANVLADLPKSDKCSVVKLELSTCEIGPTGPQHWLKHS